MTASDRRWIRIEEVFDGALDQPDDARTTWLDRECGGDTGLRHEVDRLLAAHGRVEGLLERSPLLPGSDLDERVAVALGGLYEIEEQIGAGGSARVYLARERKHDRAVVIKVLRPEAAAAFGAGRFLREVHLAAQLAHPHILGLIDSGEADGLLYYVMPRVVGQTLRDLIDAGGPGTMGLALTLLRDVAEALAYAHSHGVVHRDLKPDNVLVAGGHAYLMDFGIAMVAREGSKRLTGEGIAIGTPSYMAPEQAAGRTDLDHRTDIYAWGRLASETLAGRRLRGGLQRLIDDCQGKDPADRPADATMVVARLDAAVRAGRGRWKRSTALAGAATVLLAAVFFLRPRLPATTLNDAVAVAPFANETGDPAWDAWGRLAGDWVTQGFQETDVAPVVPWPTALQAWDRLQLAEAPFDPVERMADGTGARFIVTGHLYRTGDRFRVQAEVTNLAAGTGATTTAAAEVPADSIQAALSAVRERVLGAVALERNERYAAVPGIARLPPTLAAYREFDRGMRAFLDQRYDEAADIFHAAWQADTGFYAPMFYEAVARFNTSDYGTADTVLDLLARRRAALTAYQRDYLEHMSAVRAGDGERALAAVQRASVLAPASRATYNVAQIALALNRPQLALDALRSTDPDRGDLVGWSSYWTQLTHALHLLGRHREELDAAREMRRRYPTRRVATVLEARALAALGDTARIDSLLTAIETLAPTTYWSQGGALVVAGEELLAHGRPEAARQYLDRAVRWLANHLTRDPNYDAHRYWMGSALYDLRRWEEAAAYFRPLAAGNPDDLGDRGRWAVLAARAGDPAEARRRLGPEDRRTRGSHLGWQARIAAIGGDGQEARALLADALRYGVDGLPWLHAVAWHDYAPLLEADPAVGRLIGLAPSGR